MVSDTPLPSSRPAGGGSRWRSHQGKRSDCKPLLSPPKQSTRKGVFILRAGFRREPRPSRFGYIMVAGSVKNKRPSSAMSFRGVSREIPRDRNENNRTRTPQIFARGGSPPEVRGGEAAKGSEMTATPYYLHQEQPGRTRKGSIGYFFIVRAE